MYADISKPPAALPHAEPQHVGEGVTLLPPLSRRGHGPGLIILQDNSTQHLDIIDGVPSALIKWAEEGYTVVEIQANALTQAKNASEVFQDSLKALQDCPKLEPGKKIGIVGMFSVLSFFCESEHSG